MKKVQFGRMDLQDSPLGLGAAPSGYLNTERGKVRKILDILLDRDVNGIDNAASYAAGRPEIAVIESSVNIADQLNIDMDLPLTRRNNVSVLVKRPIANAAWKPLSSQPGLYQGYAKTYTDRFAKMGLKVEELG